MGRLTSALGRAGGDIGAVDIVEAGRNQIVRDITVAASSDEHGRRIVEAVEAVPDVTIVNVSNQVFLMHLGGRIETRGKQPIRTRADLSMAHTQGARESVKRFAMMSRRSST